jgi:hypothetical protein
MTNVYWNVLCPLSARQVAPSRDWNSPEELLRHLTWSPSHFERSTQQGPRGVPSNACAALQTSKQENSPFPIQKAESCLSAKSKKENGAKMTWCAQT